MSLTAAQDQAAFLIAEGRLSLGTIADRTAMSLRTLIRYKSEDQEFREAIEAHRKALLEEVKSSGLALVAERIRHKAQRHGLLRKVIQRRAHDETIRAYLKIPEGEGGPEAGLLVVKWKGKDANQPEFAVDTGTLAELDRIEQDIAIEVGHWKTKVEHSGEVTLQASPEVIALAKAFRPEELEEFRRRLTAVEKEQANEPAAPAAESPAETQPDPGSV